MLLNAYNWETKIGNQTVKPNALIKMFQNKKNF